MRMRKAVIPAAGMGTRLLPLTVSQPKEMLPIGRKPVIQYVLEEIQSAGIEHTLIITNRNKRSIEDYFDENRLLSGEVFYMRQAIRPGLPYGLAYAVSLSEGFVGDCPFLVCLGDCIIKSDSSGSLLKRLIHTHETHNAAATIVFEEVSSEKVSKYGIAKPSDPIGEEFQLEDIIEKPSPEEAPSNLAVAARYIFEPSIFSYLKRTPPGAGGELQLTDSIRLLLEDGLPVWGVKLAKDEVRYDIGEFAGYFKTFFDFSIGDKDFGEEFNQYVRERYLQ